MISLDALRLGREALLGVSLCLGSRAVGAERWWTSFEATHIVVALTRTTIVLASVLVPRRRVSFSLDTGLSRATNGVERSIHPAHLTRLQELLGVQAPAVLAVAS